jgi:hypothetical protein
LVEKSRAFTGLQEPLVHRADLPPQLATSMCEWVSEALKSFITTNYRMAPKNVQVALNDATRMVKIAAPSKEAPAESAQKLIDKLAASGQLKTGFLMRVLSQGQMDLFDLAFSRLLDIDAANFRTVFYSGGARIVALACRGVGIDRAVFATVFNLSRQARNLPASLAPADFEIVDMVFSSTTRQTALDELRGTIIPH